MNRTRLMSLVCGVDEAGRGPLAGPVYAAAVILDPASRIAGLADSKVLSASRRRELAGQIRRHALAWAVASASVAEIDAINILQASLLAMRRAVEQLSVAPGEVLVDGNHCPADCLSGQGHRQGRQPDRGDFRRIDSGQDGAGRRKCCGCTNYIPITVWTGTKAIRPPPISPRCSGTACAKSTAAAMRRYASCCGTEALDRAQASSRNRRTRLACSCCGRNKCRRAAMPRLSDW